jgi:hypothetical protein
MNIQSASAAARRADHCFDTIAMTASADDLTDGSYSHREVDIQIGSHRRVRLAPLVAVPRTSVTRALTAASISRPSRRRRMRLLRRRRLAPLIHC